MITKLSEIYKDFKSEEAVGNTIQSGLLLNLWKEIVDERIRKHAEPIKILNRTLYMTTSSSTWAQELSLLKREIIAKFNRMAGKEVICDLRFRSSGE